MFNNISKLLFAVWLKNLETSPSGCLFDGEILKLTTNYMRTN